MSVAKDSRSAGLDGLPAYDRELALERAGGDAVRAARYLEMLLGAFGEAREGLATGARDGNWPDMQRKLHTLAGASLYCGATALHGAAQRSEAMLKEGRVAEARPMLDLVLEEMARLETAAREGAGVEMPPDQGVDA